MQSTKARRWVQVALIAGVLAAASLPSTVAFAQSRGHAGHAGAAAMSAISTPHTAAASGGVRLTGSPGVPVVDAGTHTVYVPIQCTQVACGNGKASRQVDLINTAHCTNSACKVVAVARAGVSPFAAVVDHSTHTLYVANAGSAKAPTKGDEKGSVSVFDTRHCRAASHTRCRPLATIHTGGYLVAAAIDHTTGTLYLADGAGSVIAVDIRACTAVAHRHCHRPVHRATDRLGPSGIAVDSKYSTVYASNINPDAEQAPGHTVSLINTASCNGHQASGCAHKPRTVGVGATPYWDAVDAKTDSVYVANGNGETVSIINARTCNAKAHSSCPRTAPTVTTGGGPEFVNVDQRLHTVFALNTNDNTVAALNSTTCRAGAVHSCPSLPRSIQAAPDHGSNFVGGPSAAALDSKNMTMYLTEIGGSDTLAVTSVAACNAVKTTSCRHVAPSVDQPDASLIVDAATHTMYGANFYKKTIDLFNTTTCTAATPRRCAPVASIPVADPNFTLSSIDDATHTLYAGDSMTGDVAVIDVSSCTATMTTGCAMADKASLTVASNDNYLGYLAVNPATHTLYATYGPFDQDPNLLAEIDITSCTGQVTSGCGQTPVSTPVGPTASGLGISETTNTIYVANSGFASPSLGDTVSVINGATCDAANHTACAPVAAAQVGSAPYGVLVDDSTSSVYVVNNTDDDGAGTLSVISSATCDGTTTTGCAGRHPVIGIGREATTATVGPSGTVYVANYASAGISAANVSTCNGQTSSGCSHNAPLRAVGSAPTAIAVDAASHSIYVATNGPGGTISVLPTS